MLRSRRSGAASAAVRGLRRIHAGRQHPRLVVKRKWRRSNPFAEVEGVGPVGRGADKPRLTVDESRRLQGYCHAHAATDLGAVLTLAYLLLGPRASELVRRNVRDVDDGGRLLWIGATKTTAGRRRPLVPDELAVYLAAIAAEQRGHGRRRARGAMRPPPLFLTSPYGGRSWPGETAGHWTAAPAAS
jgi:integrase